MLANYNLPSAPFDALAATYDDIFSNSGIGRAQRRLVWMQVDRTFKAGQRILEVNCGTGIDALHLADRGVKVVACDSAPGMIAQARRRIEDSRQQASVDLRCIPTEQIAQLETEGPYDGALSNFAGLNCVSDLNPVARDLARLIRPGGKAVLCLFGRLCLWEILWHLHRSNFQKAFRRLRRKGVAGTVAEGATITVHYPSVRSLRRMFSPYFHLENRIGVGVVAPPSYAESFALRFPRLFRYTVEIDPWLGGCAGLRALADHMVLTFRRSDRQ